METRENTCNRVFEGIGSVLKWIGLAIAFIALVIAGLDDIVEVYGEFKRRQNKRILTDEIDMDKYTR